MQAALLNAVTLMDQLGGDTYQLRARVEHSLRSQDCSLIIQI